MRISDWSSDVCSSDLWVIFCWDRPGGGAARAGAIEDQRAYAKALGERLIGYGHIVSDDGAETRATTWFVQRDDRAAAEAFVADRSDARRVGQECVRTCRVRVSPCH